MATDTVNISASADVGLIKVNSIANNTIIFENNILPVDTSIDLGINSLYITNLTTQAGNEIQSTFSDDNSNIIPSSGIIISENLNLGAGTQWTLINSDSNPYINFQDLVTTNGILLAQVNQGTFIGGNGGNATNIVNGRISSH